MTSMEREIAQTAGLLRARAEGWLRACDAARERAGDCTWAVVGRGSSGHAGTYFSYAMMLAAGRAPVDLRPWAVHAATRLQGWEGTTVVALSASGQSTDVADAVERLATAGARAIAVINANGASTLLGRLADDVIDVAVGPEAAVPATKSFTAQLVVSALLAGLGDCGDVLSIADCLEALSADREAAQAVARFAVSARCVVYLARGPALAAAQDAALKLAEVAGVPAQAWSSAEVLHGPVASLGAADRVVLLADAEDTTSTEEAAAALEARGVPFMVVGRALDELTGAAAHWPLSLPEPRWARTPVLATFGQWVALAAALELGKDPDRPVGLAKVTLTL